MQSDETLLKKVTENMEKRTRFERVESQDLMKMSQYRLYQLNKQEKRAKFRNKVLSKVSSLRERISSRAGHEPHLKRRLYSLILSFALMSGPGSDRVGRDQGHQEHLHVPQALQPSPRQAVRLPRDRSPARHASKGLT
jgi:hypothetical protein